MAGPRPESRSRVAFGPPLLKCANSLTAPLVGEGSGRACALHLVFRASHDDEADVTS